MSPTHTGHLSSGTPSGAAPEGIRGAWQVLRDRWPGILAFAVAMTFLTCRFSDLLSVPEVTLFDAWMRLRPPRAPAPRIVLVGIREEEAERYQETRPQDCTCDMVSRADLGRAILRMKEGGARVIALDLILHHACPVGRGTPEGHDDLLRSSLRGPAEVILVAEPEGSGFRDPPASITRGLDPILASPVVGLHGLIRGMRLCQETQARRPKASAWEQWLPIQKTYPPLALVAYAASAGRACEMPQVLRDDLVECAGLRIPVRVSERIFLFEPLMHDQDTSSPRSEYAMLINWAGPPGTFPSYSLSQVMAADAQSLRHWFRDKIVILGALSEADRWRTPARLAPTLAGAGSAASADAGKMSGIEIHANALDTILQGRFIRALPTPWAWAVIFGCVLLTTVAFRNLATRRAIGVVLMQVAILVGAGGLLARADVWFYSVVPASAVVVAGVLTAVWGYARTREEAASLAHTLEVRERATLTLAHDLKQPLSAISAYAAAARASQSVGAGLAGHPDPLHGIQEEVEEAVGGIDELLVTDPDHVIALHTQRFDLAAVARGLAATQSMRSAAHKVEVVAPAGGMFVVADRRLLRRALNNVVDNAMKYWPEGGTVQVLLEASARHVEVRVTDQGIGMNAEQRARIFERFERALPPGMESDIPGTGLGLYSAKRILQAHGGDVTVKSEPGVGSEFSLVLPYVAASSRT